MAANSRAWRLTLPTAVVVWAAIVTLAVVYGNWLGLGGRRLAVAVAVAAALFGFEFFLAAPGLLESAWRRFGGRGALVAPLVPLAAILAYAFGVSGSARLAVAGAAYAIAPALLLASSSGKIPGNWEDYAAAVVLWIPVQFHWLYKIFPYPQPLTHTLSILLALSAGVAGFVLVRRLDRIGYAIEWRRGFAWNFGFHFLVCAAIAIAVGLRIGFITFDPSLRRSPSLPFSVLGIVLFTAWPEEFLFRGILQNLLSRSLTSEWAGLAVASVIFGLSHILHAPYPNWKYVLMATIAGLFYGRAWMKTHSLVPGTLVHAAVDISWHVIFR